MSEDLYKIGDKTDIRSKGKLDGTIEIKAVITDNVGKRQIEYKVISLVPDYSGPLEVGTTISIGEDEYVGMFGRK